MTAKIVDHDAWLAARKDLLQKEKEFTRARDALTWERQALPWEKVEKSYVFRTLEGDRTLADLFDGRSQLIVYHFMFGADWDAGCKACSFMADHFNPAVVHLAARDVTMIAASTAPLATLQAFKARMGWKFNSVSCGGSDFNQDYQVTFSQDQVDAGTASYNYGSTTFNGTEAPGASVFVKDGDGGIFHTYSVYQRGLDMFLTTYHYLDMVPKGRDEDGFDFSMTWLRHHDDYEDDPAAT